MGGWGRQCSVAHDIHLMIRTLGKYQTQRTCGLSFACIACNCCSQNSHLNDCSRFIFCTFSDISSFMVIRSSFICGSSVTPCWSVSFSIASFSFLSVAMYWPTFESSVVLQLFRSVEQRKVCMTEGSSTLARWSFLLFFPNDEMISGDYLCTEYNDHISHHLQWFRMNYNKQFGHTLTTVHMNQVKQQCHRAVSLPFIDDNISTRCLLGWHTVYLPVQLHKEGSISVSISANLNRRRTISGRGWVNARDVPQFSTEDALGLLPQYLGDGVMFLRIQSTWLTCDSC